MSDERAMDPDEMEIYYGADMSGETTDELRANLEPDLTALVAEWRERAGREHDAGIIQALENCADALARIVAANRGEFKRLADEKTLYEGARRVGDPWPIDSYQACEDAYRQGLRDGRIRLARRVMELLGERSPPTHCVHDVPLEMSCSHCMDDPRAGNMGRRIR